MEIYLRLDIIFFSLYFPGEATFTNDEPTQPHELHGVFIQSSVGSADIVSIDTSEALVSRLPLLFVTYLIWPIDFFLYHIWFEDTM